MTTDLLITDVHVHGNPGASAVAVHDGIIVAIGDQQQARAAVTGPVEHLDGAGGTLTPGLIDAHCHPYNATRLAGSVDLGHVRDWETFLQAVRHEAQRVRDQDGPDAWLQLWNLDYAVFAGRPISGSAFAEAALGLPTFVLFFDGHTAVATPRALEIAGITGRETFADNSIVVVDPDGHPTGELREDAAFYPVLAQTPKPSPAQARSAVVDVLRRMNACGVTGITSMDGTRTSLDLYDELDRSGELSMRVQTALTHRQEFGDAEIADIIAQRDRRGRRWRGGLIKLFHDGVIDTGTGWLYEPDTLGDGLVPFWPEPRRYREIVHTYAAAGFQIATHAIGDRAVGETIDTYIEVGVRSAGGAPHRVEHLETMIDADLRRAADAGIVVSMQPLHMQWRHADHSDSWAHRLGRVRSARGWRAADVLGAGALLALGSDWPVAQLDPRIGMAWAMLRRAPGDPSAPVFDEHLRLTGAQALHGYTRAAAAAMGEPRLGSIEVGAPADLALFAEDPVVLGGDEVAQLPVLATIVDGEIVHRNA